MTNNGATNQQALWSARERDFTTVVVTLSAVATAAVLTMLSGSAWGGDAQVYKTVDAQGNVPRSLHGFQYGRHGRRGKNHPPATSEFGLSMSHADLDVLRAGINVGTT